MRGARAGLHPPGEARGAGAGCSNGGQEEGLHPPPGEAVGEPEGGGDPEFGPGEGYHQEGALPEKVCTKCNSRSDNALCTYLS